MSWKLNKKKYRLKDGQDFMFLKDYRMITGRLFLYKLYDITNEINIEEQIDNLDQLDEVGHEENAVKNFTKFNKKM